MTQYGNYKITKTVQERYTWTETFHDNEYHEIITAIIKLV